MYIIPFFIRLLLL